MLNQFFQKKFRFCYSVDGVDKLYYGTVVFSEEGGVIFGNAEDDSYKFIMRGEVKEDNFYGTWENIFPDDTYAGTFHFRIVQDFNMTGIFTGNTREGDISSGTWDMNPLP